MLLSALVAISRAVAQTSSRLGKRDHLSELLTRTPPDELQLAVAYLSGTLPQGRIGIGGTAAYAMREVPASPDATLHLIEVDRALARLAALSGPGSASARMEALRDLFGRATGEEQEFLIRLLLGELRQGALEGVLIEAVAKAAGVPAARIRRAAMLEGTLPPVAYTAIVRGAVALDEAVVRPFRPIQPMLADSVSSLDEAIGELAAATLEFKLDGARIQVHKAGNEVRVFSRTLRDVTAAVPEVVTAARLLQARDAIVDGEALALRADGAPHPFQVTMRRFGRSSGVESLRESLPISPFLFDCLYVDGTSTIDEPLANRAAALGEIAPSSMIVPRVVAPTRDEAAAFLARSAAHGHEGVMVKAMTASYAAGRRGRAWLKVKQALTVDLVVLAAEWGSGRRRGTLSNLHLGAVDTERGGFVMLGKTFKGMTDEMLAWQTRTLLELEVARDAYTVYVRPELVVEIAFNDVQESPHYPGRLALRFARVKRYRSEKGAAEADTYATVQRLFREITKRDPPAR